MSEQVTAHKAEYANLLNDKTIKRWYDNLKRGSPVTADVYLRRLGHICNDLKLTPQRLLGMNESQLYELMLDTVSAMRKKVLALGTEEDLLIGLTFHNVPASLVAEFS